MHLYWTGVAADLWRAGDTSLTWLLKEAARGQVFAAGHAESGNDIPVLLSTTKAERVDGGYRFTGRKSFGSLSPVWTYLGIHGMDTSDPAQPKIVHAFMPRETKGYRIEETWDVLGMRATRSDDTILEGAVVPDRYVARVVPAGAAGIDPFVLGLFAWALLGFGNIYYALARRALDLTVESVKSKRSIGLSRSMAYHAGGAASGRRDGSCARRDRTASRTDRRRLVGRREPRGRVAGEDLRGQVPCGRGRLESRRSGPRRGRRIRDLPAERPGTAVPRRAARPNSPGELDADARDRGEDAARDQPGRNAAMGIGGADESVKAISEIIRPIHLVAISRRSPRRTSPD